MGAARGSGRTFALRFHAYGKRRYVTLGTPDDGWGRERAEPELQNLLVDVRRDVWNPDERIQHVEPTPEPTFHEFASEWLTAIRPELRPRTATDYEWALTHHLLPHFARFHLSEVTVEEVDRYKTAKLREGRLSPNMINKTLTRFAQVLEVAVEYGHIGSNPARGRRRRVKAHEPRRTWLEPEQVAPLLSSVIHLYRGAKTAPDVRTRAMLATATCAGLRVGELLDLRWRDVDLAAGRLRVIQSKTDAGCARSIYGPSCARN